jgi:divalent metal cation (Fe/Co/Zn/Cd) transporter
MGCVLFDPSLATAGRGGNCKSKVEKRAVEVVGCDREEGAWRATMASLQIANSKMVRRVQWVQLITIGWMVVEAGVSLSAAWRARSPALAAFGGDSAIELLSAMVVVWRFRSDRTDHHERRAAQIAGGLLATLAVLVISISVVSLLGYSEPRPSYLGMAVLAAAAVIMPVLAKEKRRLSAMTGSAALRADAAESAVCACLSLIALLGLVVHAVWHVGWADPLAALVITPLIGYEAREAMRGKACGCC